MEFNKELTVQQNEICMKLKQMKMSGMADEYMKQSKDPNTLRVQTFIRKTALKRKKKQRN